MEKTVYKFLDEYLGDEVYCRKSFSTRSIDVNYIQSKKNHSIILYFRVYGNGNRIVIYQGDELNQTVSNFFSLDGEETMKIIRNWFGDRHNINKVKDLMRFVN